jgi:hypothetical protein
MISRESLPEVQQVSKADNTLSIYTGSFSHDFAAKQFKRLQAAFPQITPGFCEILLERLKSKNIPDERLKASIDNLIDNFKYPVPTIANIIEFDRRIKFYTYFEMCRMTEENSLAFKYFSSVKVNGKTFWMSNADKELHNIQDEL